MPGKKTHTRTEQNTSIIPLCSVGRVWRRAMAYCECFAHHVSTMIILTLSLTFHPISTLANGQSRLTASLIMLNFFCSSCNQVARYYSCDLARCLTTEKTIIIHSNAKTSLLFVCRDCSPDQLSFLFSLTHTYMCLRERTHSIYVCVCAPSPFAIQQAIQ